MFITSFLVFPLIVHKSLFSSSSPRSATLKINKINTYVFSSSSVILIFTLHWKFCDQKGVKMRCSFISSFHGYLTNSQVNMKCHSYQVADCLFFPFRKKKKTSLGQLHFNTLFITDYFNFFLKNNTFYVFSNLFYCSSLNITYIKNDVYYYSYNQ